MKKSSSKQVEIYKRINKLRLKAGIALNEEVKGFVDPSAVKRAQTRIDDREKHYTQEIEEILVFIDEAWSDLKQADETRKKQCLDKLYNFANNVKDIAEMYGYQLMQHFGLSLRNFCEKIDVSNENHHVIVQAHIDVMWVTFKENIRDDGGPAAQELKKIVTKAIEQNS